LRRHRASCARRQAEDGHHAASDGAGDATAGRERLLVALPPPPVRLLRLPLLSGALSAPGIAVDGVDQRLHPEDLRASVQPLAEALGQADGSGVGRADQADHALAPHRREGVPDNDTRGLQRIAVAPRLAPQEPADLEARPAFRLEVAGAAEERAGGPLLERELPVALEVPLP